MVTTTASAGAPAMADPPDSVVVIVRLRDLGPGADVPAIASGLVDARGGRLTNVYEHAVQGFAAELPAPAARGLAHHPLVASVTPDQVVSIAATDPEVPTGIDRIEGDRNPAGSPVDVDIAILDTGIVDHPDLDVVSTVDCTAWLGLLGCRSGNRGSVHWHATHVAGIAAAADNGTGVEGAAPGARLWSVRVLDSQGSGSLSMLIQGIDWVTARADQIDVANMSLGGAFSDPTFDLAIANSVAAGVVYVVAAGNNGKDSAGFSPASHDDVLTISAVADSDGQPGGLGPSPSCRNDVDDTFADFSNYGHDVDLAAPGVCIRSTYPGGYAEASGTSMASPHAAGVVGRYLAVQGTDPRSAADVAAVRAAVVADALPQTGACGFTGDPDQYAEPVVFLNAVSLGGDGTCGASGPPDGAPSIEWIAPDDGTVVSGAQDVSVRVTDGEDPAGDLIVEMRADGGVWQTMTSAAGDVFAASWDTLGSPDGPTTLTVRAGDSASNTTLAERDVTVDNHPNQAPNAVFTSECDGLTCTFDASTSSDPDGTIIGWTWDFGDGSVGEGMIASHSYAADGSPQVMLTVTDDEGSSDDASQTVTVAEPTTMWLGDVYAELVGKRNNLLSADVEVRSEAGPVSGANVSGHFEVNGAWVQASAVTGSDGVAHLDGGRIRWQDFVSYFCVDGVVKEGLVLTTSVPHCSLVWP